MVFYQPKINRLSIYMEKASRKDAFTRSDPESLVIIEAWKASIQHILVFVGAGTPDKILDTIK